MDANLQALAEKALECVPANSRIGLGSGHAAEAFIHHLGEREREYIDFQSRMRCMDFLHDLDAGRFAFRIEKVIGR